MTRVQVLVARQESIQPCPKPLNSNLPRYCPLENLPEFNPSAPPVTLSLTKPPDGECMGLAKCSHPETSSLPGSVQATATPAPSCLLHHADPDQGVNKPYCLCDSTATLPVLSLDLATSPGPDASCAYTAIPTITGTSSFAPVTTLGPVVTNTRLCQACTPVVVNEDTCTILPNCIPQAAQVKVQAGSSPVHVGTLTGSALYTSMSSAMEKLCPPVTQTNTPTICSVDTVKIGDIPHPEAGNGYLEHGELLVTIEASQYNETSLRNAMIQATALAIQNSAAGKNCYDMQYDAEIIEKRGLTTWVRDLLGLQMHARDHATIEHRTMRVCNGAGFAGTSYYGPYWRQAPEPGATNYLAAHLEFHVVGGDFICEIAQECANRHFLEISCI